MSNKYACPTDGCENGAVLVNSGGVARTLICPDHNVEMTWVESVSTEWVGIEDPDNDYAIVEDDR